jgi:prepilin-type N-terminal cleavage/methylation domain-containing protein
MERRGFTLIELLVVVALISILAAVLFPVFATARGKARQAACISNLDQIGIAIALYAQDNNDYFPYADDPSDQKSIPNLWAGTPYAAQVKTMPYLQDVLTPYISSQQIWRCPSDTGYDMLDMDAAGAPAVYLDARPTAFAAFGTSYLYRTQIPLLHLHYGTLVAYKSSGSLAGPSEINVLMDGSGSWHGGPGAQGRYDVLMADGRVASLGRAQYFTQNWSLSFTDPALAQ